MDVRCVCVCVCVCVGGGDQSSTSAALVSGKAICRLSPPLGLELVEIITSDVCFTLVLESSILRNNLCRLQKDLQFSCVSSAPAWFFHFTQRPVSSASVWFLNLPFYATIFVVYCNQMVLESSNLRNGLWRLLQFGSWIFYFTQRPVTSASAWFLNLPFYATACDVFFTEFDSWIFHFTQQYVSSASITWFFHFHVFCLLQLWFFQ
jgi:hypothetical protein